MALRKPRYALCGSEETRLTVISMLVIAYPLCAGTIFILVFFAIVPLTPIAGTDALSPNFWLHLYWVIASVLWLLLLAIILPLMRDTISLVPSSYHQTSMVDKASFIKVEPSDTNNRVSMLSNKSLNSTVYKVEQNGIPLENDTGSIRKSNFSLENEKVPTSNIDYEESPDSDMKKFKDSNEKLAIKDEVTCNVSTKEDDFVIVDKIMCVTPVNNIDEQVINKQIIVCDVHAENVNKDEVLVDCDENVHSNDEGICDDDECIIKETVMSDKTNNENEISPGKSNLNTGKISKPATNNEEENDDDDILKNDVNIIKNVNVNHEPMSSQLTDVGPKVRSSSVDYYECSMPTPKSPDRMSLSNVFVYVNADVDKQNK